MGMISNKIDRSLLEPGDHIYCYRNLHSFSHHGIYVGENKVIHFTRTEVEQNNDQDLMTSCKDCGYNPRRGGVVKCCLACFLKGHRLFRFKYGVSSSRFIMNRTGTCTTGTCRYSPDEVVQRATSMLHSDEGFGKYHLLDNNCESFAVYCKTGKRLSLQAFSLRSKVKTTFDEFTRQPFSVKKSVKIVSKTVMKHKMDTLRHDIAMHQQDDYDHWNEDDNKDAYYKYGRR